MEKRRFDKTDLVSSAVGFGTLEMNNGTPFLQQSVELLPDKNREGMTQPTGSWTLSSPLSLHR